jgi:glycosyltransferase involved in cell wall biosynthesis
MPDTELISVVVTTYNRSDALALVLTGLKAQSDPHFEVVIADDGSSAEHREAAKAAIQRLGFEAVHMWHPDAGFTVSQVRNLGVAAARGKYIIFLDGDCVPEVDFVAQHRKLMQQGCFVNGSRVLLSAGLTEDLLSAAQSPGGQAAGYWMWQRLGGRASKLTGLLRFPDGNYRCHLQFRWKGIRSCNLAVWRADYERVNGFDETFVGWGHEDADFVLRLHNAGLVRKNGFCATEVFHLWHRESNRSQQGINADKVRARIDSGQVRATVGYEESLAASDVAVQTWG